MKCLLLFEEQLEVCGVVPGQEVQNSGFLSPAGSVGCGESVTL